MRNHGLTYWPLETWTILTKVRPISSSHSGILVVFFTYSRVFMRLILPSLTVLMGLEQESGQLVGQAVEKQFTGDIRLGLKVLGNAGWGTLTGQCAVCVRTCLNICVLTVQCIQSSDAYLAKRLTTTKVWCCQHSLFLSICSCIKCLIHQICRIWYSWRKWKSAC